MRYSARYVSLCISLAKRVATDFCQFCFLVILDTVLLEIIRHKKNIGYRARFTEKELLLFCRAA